MSTMESKLIVPVSRHPGNEDTSVGYPVGVATDKGPRRPANADAYAAHLVADTQAAVVFDGTGSEPDVVEFAAHAAWTAARVAARKGPGYAILHAAELNAIPDSGRESGSDAGLPEPDGAIVVATVHPTAGWSIAHAGDCTAFSFHDGRARRVTHAHTVAQLLRDFGLPDDVAAGRDHQLIHSLGRARPGTVPVRRFEAPIVVLGSDGLKLTEKQVAEVIGDHHADPGAATAIASDLVAAARPHTSDDITALVAFATAT